MPLPAQHLCRTHSSYAFWITNDGCDGQICLASDRCGPLLGWGAAELTGRAPRCCHGPRTDARTLQEMEARTHLAGEWLGVLTHYRRDGAPLPLNVFLSRIPSSAVAGGLGMGSGSAETRTRNACECATDCATSAFSAWSACSQACGTGSQSRSRATVEQPTFGGKACPHSAETRTCNAFARTTDTESCNGCECGSQCHNTKGGATAEMWRLLSVITCCLTRCLYSGLICCCLMACLLFGLHWLDMLLVGWPRLWSWCKYHTDSVKAQHSKAYLNRFRKESIPGS